jgi:hypothetical protein
MRKYIATLYLHPSSNLSRKAKTYPLRSGRNVIGSSKAHLLLIDAKNTIQIEEPEISDTHVAIIINEKDKTYFVEDLRSELGTSITFKGRKMRIKPGK